MRRMFKLIIAYDGTNYSGWQKQINGKTIEGELIKACSKVFKEPFTVKGSSRTDAGVHALGQVASLEVDSDIVLYKVVPAINCYLPDDIIVQSAEEVDLKFHPRYLAKEKTYSYKIYNAKVPLPQTSRYTYFFYKPLDLVSMQHAAKYFMGEHDFIAFSSPGGSVKTSIRTVYKCEIIKKESVIEIVVTGSSFLYNMVRIMVGTLIDVGLGRLNPEEIPDIIASKDRRRPGKKAPAKGLTLVEIKY